ncbi:MAG TPA: DUF5681 domain-containing protein [Candidatus Binatia bacterium]|nr:DUF5681 domain-containing protein [Candidatus Binatia bacterium]
MENSIAVPVANGDAAVTVVEEPQLPEFENDTEVKAHWLKKYRWKKGQSGNPGGRPRKKPYTEAIEMTGEMPCPPDKRKGLERAMKLKLPRNLTLLEANAIGAWLQGITDQRVREWLADRTDGTIKAEIQLGALPGGAPTLIPNITIQLVEVNANGETIRTITMDPPPPIGQEPNRPAPKPVPVADLAPYSPQPANGKVNGSGDAATELPGSDPR